MRKLQRFVPLLALLIFSLWLYAAEKLTDGGLENWDDATHLTSWSESASGSTFNRDDGTGGVALHGGTYMVRMDIDGSNGTANFYQNFTLTSSAAYELSIWYYIDTASKTAYMRFHDTANNVWLDTDGTWAAAEVKHTLATVGSWTEVAINFNAHASYTNYRIYTSRFSASSSSLYFDDYSISDAAVSFVPKVIIIKDENENGY